MDKRIRNTVLTGVMAAAVAVISVWQIPMPFGVPLTFQIFAAALSGYVLGALRGGTATAIYIALGCVGAPVFSGFAGGLSHLAGPTGGFVAGFIPVSLLCGAFRDRGRTFAVFSGIAGLVLCHAIGVLWCATGTDVSVLTALLTVSLPYFLKDTLLLAGAYFVSLPVRRAVDQRQKGL